MPKEIGKNVKFDVKGTKLTIEVDLSQTFGPSKSKKTLIIASSEGNALVTGDIKMGLNIYKPNPNPNGV